MPFEPRRPTYALMTGLSLLLSGCVYTGSDFTGASSAAALKPKNPAGVLVVEGTISTSRKYCVMGTVDAYAHKFSVFAPEPTRQDVNEALRAKTAEIGADAVIQVQYSSESTFFPPSSLGRMGASGKAVMFVANDQPCRR